MESDRITEHRNIFQEKRSTPWQKHLRVNVQIMIPFLFFKHITVILISFTPPNMYEQVHAPTL